MFIGGHESVSPSILKACQTTTKMGGNALQIFLRSPMRNGPIKLKEKDVEKSSQYLRENEMRLVVHSSYLLNFSKPVEANEASFSTIIGDLQFADNLEAIGCIIHMGKHLKLSVDDAFDNYIASVNKICEEKNSNSLLILENSAHQGTEIGYSIDHLARIYDGITEANREKIGFCLDTCHAFAAGYNFCEEDGVTGFFEEFEEKIGLEKVVCIHLNDSKKKCNSCVDRHERLGVGMIGLDGIKYILKYLKEMNFGGIIVLETPYDSYESRLEEVGMMKEVFA